MIRLITALLSTCIVSSLCAWSPSALAQSPRILKFSGVPMSHAGTIRKAFPFVFEREVTLAEVDEIVRFLMKSGQFSAVEVIERDDANGSRELVLVASVLRVVKEVDISGNDALSSEDVRRILGLEQGRPFEREDLLAAAGDLRKAYEEMGYHNSKVEIDFDLTNDNEVNVSVAVDEGSPVRISEILIDSPNAQLARRLKYLGNAYGGQILTDENVTDFQKEVADYFQENRYLTSRLSRPTVNYNPARTEARLIYSIENPWRYEFLLEGHRFFTEWDILSRLELDRLTGAVSSPAPDLADRIRRAYQTVGFTHVDIQYKERTIEPRFVHRISFKIKEGPRVRIRDVEVTGNLSRPPDYYADFIKGYAPSFGGKGYYNRKEVEESGKQLLTELQNQGYLRAVIQSQRAEFSKNKSSVTLFLAIDEGPLTQIRQIRFKGLEAFPRDRILEQLKIKSGMALSLRDLEESLQILKDFYRSHGYLEMRILNENEERRIVSYNETNTQATVEFQIYEGPRVKVSSVNLKGNSSTKDHVIKREIAFGPGDVLTPEKIDTTVFQLQSLGLFSQVSVRTLEEGTDLADRTVIVELVERDPGLFTMGLGINNEQELTFRGYLGIAYRNLAGTGRAISFRVDPKYSTDPRISFIENKMTLSYLEPYIFGYRNRGRVNLTREQSYSPASTDERTLIQEENSIGLLIERDLTRHVKLTYTVYGFSNQRQFERVSRDTVETQNIAKVGPLLELDYRDDVFNPAKGHYSFLNLEYSDPVLGSSGGSTSDIHFVKTNASVTHYLPLTRTRRVVWANSVRGGYLRNLSSAAGSGVPSQEAFFLGGRSSIRGFDVGSDQERIPNIFQLNVEDLTQFRVTNESAYYLLKTELRFPIAGPFGGALFYDGGAVTIWQPGVDLDDPYRHAAGLGVRVATPVGALSFDFAWKLNQRTGESPWAFHFAIGTF